MPTNALVNSFLNSSHRMLFAQGWINAGAAPSRYFDPPGLLLIIRRAFRKSFELATAGVIASQSKAQRTRSERTWAKIVALDATLRMDDAGAHALFNAAIQRGPLRDAAVIARTRQHVLRLMEDARPWPRGGMPSEFTLSDARVWSHAVLRQTAYLMFCRELRERIRDEGLAEEVILGLSIDRAFDHCSGYVMEEKRRLGER